MKKRKPLGSFTNQIPHNYIVDDEHQRLSNICLIVNLGASMNYRRKDTCIATSYALAYVLQKLGYSNAYPLRVEATASPYDCKLGGVACTRFG